MSFLQDAEAEIARLRVDNDRLQAGTDFPIPVVVVKVDAEGHARILQTTRITRSPEGLTVWVR